MNKIEGVIKGSLILTEDLRCVQIEEIKVGDMIIGFSSDDSRYLKFTTTRVLKIFRGRNHVYRIKTNHGDICSTYHHIWLTGPGQRLRDTYKFKSGQFLRNISTSISPIETNDYKIGYIAGSYDGDGYISDKYRLAKLVGDYEMMDMSLKYSDELGLGLRETYYNGGKFALDSCIITTKVSEKNYIKDIISQEGNDDYKKGYLAGIYDAEGSFDMTLRFYNTNERILNKIAKYLHNFGFMTEFDIMRSECAIRILGGTSKFIDFLILVNPKSENKKIYLFNTHLKIKKYSIISGLTFENDADVYNLETTAGNYVTNGFVGIDINRPIFLNSEPFRVFKTDNDINLANDKFYL